MANRAMFVVTTAAAASAVVVKLAVNETWNTPGEYMRGHVLLSGEVSEKNLPHNHVDV